MDLDTTSENERAHSKITNMLRKPYRQPVLERLGDLRTLTLGSSPSGTKDSGVGTLYEKIGDKIIPDFPPLDEFQQPGDPYIPPL